MRRQKRAAEEDGLGAPGGRLLDLVGEQVLAEVFDDEEEVVALVFFCLFVV